MRMFTALSAALCLSTAIASAPAFSAEYQVDPTHTSVIASWSHFGFSHPTASFSGVSGMISFDVDEPEKASVSITIPVNTVDTKVPTLTEEFINGADYFDSANYPAATFTSTQVTDKGENRFDVAGDLTIKGVTRPVVMQVTLNGMGEHPMAKKPAIGFDATAVIKRSEFNMGIHTPYVSDEVTLTITTEALGGGGDG